MERYRLLGGVIAAHPDRRVVGRTRLQHTVWLLQRLALPTNYSYTELFYGPYSEGLQAEIGLLDRLGLITQELKTPNEGNPFYIIEAVAEAVSPLTTAWQAKIELISQETDPVVLELAATYDSFRKMGSAHAEALDQLRRKKGDKCEPERVAKALELLRKLGLPTEAAGT